MGFTPPEGLIMGTRCGDVDPGVLAFLEREHKLSASKSEDLLNKKSGLLGLSGVSSDMREVLQSGRCRAINAHCSHSKPTAIACANTSAPTSHRWADWIR